MSKELLARQERLREHATEVFANIALEVYPRAFLEPSLTQRGKKPLRRAVHGFQHGEPVNPSDYIDIFDGNTVFVGGAEHLDELGEKPFIIATNHIYENPARGFWQMPLLNRYVQRATGRELRWVFGPSQRKDSNSFVGQAYERFAKPVLDRVHEKIIFSIHAIPVNQAQGLRSGGRDIFSGATAMHPERDPSVTLKQGDKEAGRALLVAAQRGIPLIPVACWSQKNHLYIQIGAPVSQEHLKRVARLFSDKNEKGQAVADEFMGVCVAPLMPKRLRGVYDNYKSQFVKERQ